MRLGMSIDRLVRKVLASLPCLRTFPRRCIVGLLVPSIAHLNPSLIAGQEGSAGNRAQGGSCSLLPVAPLAHGQLSDADILTAYRSQASYIRSLEMTAMVRASGGAEYGAHKESANARPSPAVIQFQAPTSLRMTGVIPFAARRSYDVSSDGRELRLLVPDGKIMRFYIGSVDAPAVSANPREDLRPQPLIDALHWPQGRLVRRSPQHSQEQTRVIDLDLDTRAQKEAKTAEVEFDSERGVITQLTLNDKMGQTIAKARYSDWESMTQNGAGSAPLCFPKRIDLIEPRQHLQLELKILSFALNPAIAPGTFRLNQPRGVTVTRLAAPDANKGR